MRLPDFILENLEPILQVWEDFARTIDTPGEELDSVALRDHAEQMLRAIVSDAVQHGDTTRPIQVELGMHEGFAVFTVRNSGEAIPEDLLPFIFNPMGRFSQRTAIHHGPTEGLGLGLFIASEIVASHSGSIEVSSDTEQGTVFQVRIAVNR